MKVRVLIFLTLMALPVFIFAQAPAAKLSPNVQEHKLNSKLMAREIPYRVIVPAGYTNTNETSRYPVLYLLHGLYGHYDNWTDKTKIAEYAAAYKIIIVTPEGGDGWYSDSAATPNDKYESYIVQELIPEIDKNFRTLSSRDKRAIAGLSMGGYGSLKFGLKYPDKFVLAGSFSGALGAATFTEKGAGAIGKTIDAIFGAEGSSTRNANDIFKIVDELTAEKIKALPFIYVDCGTEDFLFQNNRDFDSLLIKKKIPHEFRELPGVHDWKYWDKQVQEILRIADRSFGG